jgi:hypothetical protein
LLAPAKDPPPLEPFEIVESYLIKSSPSPETKKLAYFLSAFNLVIFFSSLEGGSTNIFTDFFLALESSFFTLKSVLFFDSSFYTFRVVLLLVAFF